MRQAIALLLGGALLSGCSTVGNVFSKTGQVLMDPEIQVGAIEDQPTQIALSLYASSGVNPNPIAEPDIDLDISEPLDEGPFAVNLHSKTREELVLSLRALLTYLQEELRAAPTTIAGVKQPPTFELNVDATQPSFVFDPWVDVSSAMSPVPSPAHWGLRQGTAPEDADDVQALGAEPEDVALGQYRRQLTLSPAPAPEVQASASATPVSFRVIQLKDDSLLENADPNLIHSKPKKALGSTYITADDYLLVPGQFKFVNFSALDEKTRYIAVVAAFHAPDAQRWYDVFRVEPRGRKYALLVTLQDTRVAITDESYRPEHAAPHAPTQARKYP